MREIKYPTIEQVERLHVNILDMTGGEHGDLSKSNLEYILNAIREIGQEPDPHRAIVTKATYLLYNLVVQHPFVNGNKRTAYELVKLFVRLNGYDIKAEIGDTYSFLAEIAMGKLSQERVKEWIATNLRKREAREQ